MPGGRCFKVPSRTLKHLPPGIIQEDGKEDFRLLLEGIITQTINTAIAAKANNLLASCILDECSKAFEQLQANVGSLRTPDILFNSINIHSNLESLPMESGILPVNMMQPKQSLLKPVLFTIQRGMFPDIEFPSTANQVMVEMLEYKL
ncbi:hypothetical protein Vadar_025910 [Vaccinium darrowii]|uniref:Uncharacterized protein n=1 Tax=Vaccinium darrowii TaxID=229202 RepID=A0ACB7Y8Y7_9ERIC|nr:hypothetical protein Vadar_025910 [Vaccinium darrowii]